MWLTSANCKTALVSARGVVLVKYCGREKKNVPRRGEVVVFTMYFLGLTFFFLYLVVNSQLKYLPSGRARPGLLF